MKRVLTIIILGLVTGTMLGQEMQLDIREYDTEKKIIEAVELSREYEKNMYPAETRSDSELFYLSVNQRRFFEGWRMVLIRKLYQDYPQSNYMETLLPERWGLIKNFWYMADLTPEIEWYTKQYPDYKGKIEWGWFVNAYSKIKGNRYKNEIILDAFESYLSRYPEGQYKWELLDYALQLSKDSPAKKSLEAYQSEQKFELVFEDVLTGRTIDMTHLRGKVVVVDFWATWCGPCVGEVPHMIELYKKYKGQGVEFIGISLDSNKDRLVQFCQSRGISYPQYFDGKGWENEVARSWGVQSIPTIFILDRTGGVYSKNARGQLDMLISELLGQ